MLSAQEAVLWGMPRGFLRTVHAASLVLALGAAAACSSSPSGAGVDPDQATGEDTSSSGGERSLYGGGGSATGVSAGSTGSTGGAGSAGGADSVGASCEAGQTRVCSGEQRCSGEQTCNPEGIWSACSCGGMMVVGTGGTTLLGGGPGQGGQQDTLLGASCEQDADCGEGLSCLTAEGAGYFGLGVAGGYCSRPCTADGECQALDSLARCLSSGQGNEGLCVRGCLSMDAEPDENKCFGRPDVVCNSLVAAGLEVFNGMRQEGYCRPLCGSDADCPEGRTCHPAVGACTNTPAEGGDVGQLCEEDEDCKSRFCEPIGGGLQVCGQRCVLGEVSGCGFAAEAESRQAACLTALVQQSRFSEGVGDIGLCREVCSVDQDCANQAEGWSCRPLSEGASEFFGVVGACVPPEAAE